MIPAKKTSQTWLPSVFNDFFGNEWLAKTASTAPAINIKETPTEYNVEIAAPGLTKDDFKITINDENQLVVSVQKTEDNEDKCNCDGKYLRREFAYTQFQQTMILPENVEKDKIEAEVDNGVLKINIPKAKAPETTSKVIDIK